MYHLISVVIPAYNSAAELQQCLESLRCSKSRPFECIVVDDGSFDDSAQIAASFGATVLSAGKRSGPARARNIGAAAATGDILVFLDADVCVAPETLGQIFDEFGNDPQLDALIGAYDDHPSAPNFVSQYRNLMHCFVHRNSKRKATTFWAGCGAIRRQVFLDFGGFDEKYVTPAIEDIELGYRLSLAQRKLVLRPDIQVKHLKRWGVRSMMKADFFYRALPWSALALESGRMPNDLNLRISQRISVALVCLLASLGAYSTVRWRAYFLTPLFASFFLLLTHYWIENLRTRSASVTTLVVTNVALIIGLAYWYKMFAIIPLILIACIALFARHRYAHSREIWRRRTGAALGVYCLLVAGLVWLYFPWAPVGSAFLLLILTLVLLNMQFYMFLAGNRGKLFALAAVPFHLLYFASSGLAFGIALIRHSHGKLLRPMPTPAPVVFPPEPLKSRAAAQ